MTFQTLEWRRHVASLVLRPFDALNTALGRPVYERGPIYQVSLTMIGKVDEGVVSPFGDAAPMPVSNPSGDSVFRDLSIPSGQYRIALERGTGQKTDLYYEDLDPEDSDIDWVLAAEFRLEVEGRPHPSQLHRIALYPAAGYPFQPESTLVRGSLLWFDGTPMMGAVVRDQNFGDEDNRTALISRSRVGSLGDFVLVRALRAASSTIDLKLDLTAVDVSESSRSDYKDRYPSVIPGIRWRSRNTVSVSHASLRGVVFTPDGCPAQGTRVVVAEWPGAVEVDGRGSWVYHFPPLTPESSVEVTFSHPDYETKTVPDVPVIAGGVSRIPPTRMTNL